MKLNSYFVPALLALLLHGAVFFVLADVWFDQEKEVRRVPRHVSAQIVDLKTVTTQADKKASGRRRQEKGSRASPSEKSSGRKTQESCG